MNVYATIRNASPRGLPRILIAALAVCGVAKPAYAQAEVIYLNRQGTGVARAFCPRQMPVVGGGAFVETPARGAFKEEKLRQTHPISDRTGTFAFGSTAVGW